MGAYYDQPPPPSWVQLLPARCNVRIRDDWNHSEAYLTPWCVGVHRQKRKMYDARLCLRRLLSPAELQQTDTLHPLHSSDLVDACLLRPQPLDLLFSSASPSHYTEGAQRLNKAPVGLSPDWDLAAVGEPPKEDHISHVLDWWPTDTAPMPVGFHVTAPMLQEELAPVGFDSHYAWDGTSVNYVHSALRNATLLGSHLGAGGLCRAHSVGMPLFNANTNRLCTRSPLKEDSPHLPVDLPFAPPTQMGPYDPAWLAKHYGPQLCAASPDELSWLKTEGTTAGALPLQLLSLDAAGVAWYADSVFPSPAAMMRPLRGLYTEWGPACSSTVRWSTSPPCRDDRPQTTCPKNTACLRLRLSSPEGLCFSIEAFRQDSTRAPCFTTEHCPDGLVCLADGGCAPLYLHVWNPSENGIASLEFGVLADRCGFSAHQSLRGASAWEQVPDLLHAHGMCSHRSWFAYRNALQDGVCALDPANPDLMVCNASTAVWPDIQMHYGGCRASATERPTMQNLSFLQMLPHPCDMDYLHWQVEGRRMELCSGYQGQIEAPGAYLAYPLLLDEGPVFAPPTANATFWMRTYHEPTDLLHVGNLMRTPPSLNNSLGFLGGERNSSHPILADLASNSARFFRCADRIACQMPEYTYGGARIDPRREVATGANFSELSLRRCGPMGALQGQSGICRLEVQLFPLFAYLLQRSGDPNTRGCWALWPPHDYLFTNQLVLPMPPSTASLPSPNSFFCNYATLLCLYTARPSPVLTEASAADSVAKLAQGLNRLLLDTKRRVMELAAAQGALATYEDINVCSKTLMAYTNTLQAPVQALYGSLIPSGLYVALRLSLYEFPQQWFHQCMLTVLLSTLDASVEAPETTLMDAQAPLPLVLWSVSQRNDLCARTRTTGLHEIVCSQLHPTYTFSEQTADLPRQMVASVQAAILEGAHAELFDNQKRSVVECAESAVWTDLQVLQRFYREGCRPQSDLMCSAPNNSTLFTFQARRLLDMTALGDTADGSYLRAFLLSSTQSVAHQAPSLSHRIDYVVGQQPGLVQVWGIDTSLFQGFVDTGAWAQHACNAAVPDPFCPPAQSELLDTDPCLYEQEMEQFYDADHYFVEEAPLLRILMSNGSVVEIPICPWLNSNTVRLVDQVTLGYADEDEDGNLIPVIQEVSVPPGIFFTAYAGLGAAKDWKGVLPKYSAVPCALSKELQQPSWWPGAEGAEGGGGFEPLIVDFSDMRAWHACTSYPAVIALEYRLESSFFTQSAATFCSVSAQVPLTLHGFNLRKPNCGHDASGRPLRAFRLCDAPGRSQQALWRCAPCTRYRPQAVAQGGMFQCSLPGGAPLSTLFTETTLAQTFPFLYQPDALQALLQAPVQTLHFLNQSTALLVQAPLFEDMGELARLSHWGGQYSDPQCFKARALPECQAFGEGYDPSSALQQEREIWNRAVDNPALPFTMTCDGQQYTSRSQEQCNPVTDRRRQSLAHFVETQHRQANGAWLQQVQEGWGVGFQANVAHSAVGRFSLFYASGDRPPQQVLSAWALGTGPCASRATTLEDRLCVESTLDGTGWFEPMHPWVGGDFNPFMSLDECPFLPQAQCQGYPTAANSGQQQQGVSMCACACAPAWACGGSTFNYSVDFMLSEFPLRKECLIQSYAQARVMNTDDASHLCALRPQQQVCETPHGILGGRQGTPVTAIQLHARSGIPVSAPPPQTLYDDEDGLLWTGSTSDSAFLLAMPRNTLHPAHIAFGLNRELGNRPFQVQGLALLPHPSPPRPFPAPSWAKQLPLQWRKAQATLNRLYPQLQEEATSNSTGDWSCPIRSLVFWGSSTPGFGPITPSPVVAARLYNLSGVHPLIEPEGPYPHVADYYTPNGVCFYRQDSATWPKLDVADRESPCGLRGTLHMLATATEAPITIQEPFATRCNDIIDAPNAGGRLRSGEQLPPAPDQMQACGLLHRLTPALIATRGDSASIQREPALTTHSEGGDCHMGRLPVIESAAGLHQCATVRKDAHNITVQCPHQRTIVVPRARPLSLQELVAKPAVVYRSAGSRPPAFVGPAGVPLVDNEISFGFLYAATLKETLSDNLLRHGARPQGAWTGPTFWARYANGSLAAGQPQPTPPRTEQEESLARSIEAELRDAALWNRSNWVWSFLNHSAGGRGTLASKAQWLRNRTRTCNASMEAFLASERAQLQTGIRRIALCAPAPTGDLATLCTAMTQLAVDVTQANCQAHNGHGDCLANLGMFYLPYMWSSTNQAYSYNTVLGFYQSLLTRAFPNESCPAQKEESVLDTLSRLSAAQNAICPATGLNHFKLMLADLRKAGQDLLRLAYYYVMLVANLIAAVFTMATGDAGLYLQTAIQYLLQMLVLIKDILLMLLDIFTELLMYVSTLGKVLSSIVKALCITYNWVIQYLLSELWCAFVRPTLIAIVQAIKALAFISTDVMRTMDSLLAQIGTDSVAACVRSFQSKGSMTCPSERITEFNASLFQPQAMATLCWAQQGGGIYTTGATDSLLTCTSSDTCALEPLRYDSALVYCGSCPAQAGVGFQFGCDVYLQRCVCGTLPHTKSPCLTNADCSQPSALCGVGARLDSLRSSYIAVPCAECGGLSTSPVCFLDGGDATGGVCGCANVLPNLLACSDLGSPSLVTASSTQLCPMVTDATQQQLLAQASQPQAVAVDFSSVAVAPCNTGGHLNLCLNVHVPLVTGMVESPYIVLLSSVLPFQSSRRRLLSLLETRPVPSKCSASGAHRDARKRCLYWAHLGTLAVEQFNLSHEGESLFAPDTGVLLALHTLAPDMWSQPALRTFLIQHMPYGPALLETAAQVTRFTERLSAPPRRGLLQQPQPSPELPPQQGDWTLNCSTIAVPLSKISSAFWITVQFYQNNGTQPNTSCDLTQGWSSCLGYSLPPQSASSSPPPASWADWLLYIPTLGMGGERFVQTLLSPIPYEDAQTQDLITGQRVLQDLGMCNFTRLTLGPVHPRSFLPMFLFLVALFTAVSHTCLPLSFCSYLLWYLLFPVALFWSMYNVSPLCWPMIPPRFVHDVHMEVNALIPTQVVAPRYLVRPHCTVEGKLSDGTYDAACFASCSEPPYLFKSWQDTLIWWVCEASTSTCQRAGQLLLRASSSFRDLASSADYYAAVLQHAYMNPELVQAHRLCALLSTYNLIFLLLAIGIACYLLPSVLLAILDILAGCLLLIMETYNTP
jgi:hypothetical protein